MPKEDNKILQYSHGEKSVKVPFIIYADLESLLKKMNTCHNNPKKSSTSLFTHCPFDTTKKKLDYYRVKNCMKNFCLNLREHTTKVINYEKKRNDTINKKRKENIVSKNFVIYAKKD